MEIKPYSMTHSWPELGWSEEITTSWKQGPAEQTIPILDRSLELVQNVPYKVTLRWLFYGIWQEGFYSYMKATERASEKRRSYESFKTILEKLRHSGSEIQDRWPIELIDDRRDPIYRSEGFDGVSEWLSHQKQSIECLTDKMASQDYYTMVAFEAEAMLSQFKYLTKDYHVNLWPFSGHASIPYKKRLAQEIDWARNKFDLPVVILYFGDKDKKGEEIGETGIRHVRKWSKHDFTAYRVGLNKEHVDKYNLPDDPEKEGSYQWEALRDEAARDLIQGALDEFIDTDRIDSVLQAEQEVTLKVKEALDGMD